MAQAVQFDSVTKRTKLEQEIEGMEAMQDRNTKIENAGLAPSPAFAGSVINDKQMFQQKLASKKKQLELTTPPSVEEMTDRGISREKLMERHTQLAEAIVNPQGKFPRMLSTEEMDQCPAGADDMNRLHHTKIAHHNVAKDGTLVRCDHAKGQMPMYVEYKNLCRILGKDSEVELDNTIANMETLRTYRHDKNDSLMDFKSRMYGSPAANLSAQEFEDRVGIDGLNPIQKYIHEQEKARNLHPPTMEEHMDKVYGTDFVKPDEPEVQVQPVADISVSEVSQLSDEPLYVGSGKWAMPDGSFFMGVEDEAIAHWVSIMPKDDKE